MTRPRSCFLSPRWEESGAEEDFHQVDECVSEESKAQINTSSLRVPLTNTSDNNGAVSVSPVWSSTWSARPVRRHSGWQDTHGPAGGAVRVQTGRNREGIKKREYIKDVSVSLIHLLPVSAEIVRFTWETTGLCNLFKIWLMPLLCLTTTLRPISLGNSLSSL